MANYIEWRIARYQYAHSYTSYSRECSQTEEPILEMIKEYTPNKSYENKSEMRYNKPFRRIFSKIKEIN